MTVDEMQAQQNQTSQSEVSTTKFCKHCGGKIPQKAVLCTLCGCQVEEISPSQQQPNVVINNTNTNMNTNNNLGMFPGKPKNKWVSLLLCLFLGVIGGHKFYEGKIGTGILYFFTGGLFIIGVIIDFINLLTKPNPYYV